MTKVASCFAGVSACDDGLIAKNIDQRLEELKLHPITQKSRALGSLFYLVRSEDKSIFKPSTINRDIQLLLGDILLDEYGSMKSI